jgi:hypothetical protein
VHCGPLRRPQYRSSPDVAHHRLLATARLGGTMAEHDPQGGQEIPVMSRVRHDGANGPKPAHVPLQKIDDETGTGDDAHSERGVGG